MTEQKQRTAIAEAEAVLNTVQTYRYWDTLHDLIPESNAMSHWHATAAQRREALVRTLELCKD